MDPTSDFFDRIDGQRPEQLSRYVQTTMRFDIEHDGIVDRWFVAFEDATVHVSREERPADSTVRSPKGLFDRIVTGEVDLGAAVTSNRIVIEGPLLGLAQAFRMLLPGPPGAHDPRDFARERTR